jgi:hypothetical protein
MSDQSDTTNTSPTDQTTGSSSQNNTNYLLGYCHECDRQVDIRQPEMSCTQCNGGFIELLDENTTTNHQQQQQQQSPNQQMIMTQLLQNIAQQLQTHSGRGVGGGGQPVSASLRFITPHMATTTGQMNRPGNHMNTQMRPIFRTYTNRYSPTPTTPTTTTSTSTSTSTSTGESSGTPTSTDSANAAHAGATPGQQFDLYGIINNVLSDILDPRRQQQANSTLPSNPSNTFQFNFQSPPV